jgi:DNA invertase Pin-like site-specific DNA recombinase
MEDDNKKLACYIRVSTEQQKQEGRHKKQKELLEEYSEEEDYDKVDFYQDIAVSGQSNEREAYKELMDSYEDYDAIAVRELSRFGRDHIKVLRDIQKILESDTEFISLKEDFINSDTAEGKLLLNIISAFNEFFANLRREQALEMVQRRKEQGKHVGRPKKLSEEEMDKVAEWREAGLSYSDISRMVELEFGKSIDRSTIHRYCDELDIED